MVTTGAAGFRGRQVLHSKTQRRRSTKRPSRYQSYQGNNYALSGSTGGRINDGPLRTDHRWLFMLHWAARAANVLITPAAT